MKPETIVLLWRITFDELENSIECAVVRRCLGAFVGDDAQRLADEYKEERIEEERGKTYQGWDRRTYPRYETQEVEVLG